jgi:hypothetical protein
VNPFAIWTGALLKSGLAVLDSLEAVVAKPHPAKVAVIPTPDAPPQPAVRRKARKPRVKARVRAKAKRTARR